MGVEKNGRYLKKMIFMSILVLIIDVIVSGSKDRMHNIKMQM